MAPYILLIFMIYRVFYGVKNYFIFTLLSLFILNNQRSAKIIINDKIQYIELHSSTPLAHLKQINSSFNGG